MHRWKLDRLLFRNLVHRGSQLLLYARQQAQMRIEADQSRKDFFWYVANGENKDGSKAYDDPREVFSEARTLIIGGMSFRVDELLSVVLTLTI